MESAAGVKHDLSIYNLVMNADPVVQAIMAGLVLASIVCWAIIFEKMVRLMFLSRDVRRLERAAAEGAPGALEETLMKTRNSGLVGAILAAAESESTEGACRSENRTGVRERLERAMRTAMKRELARIESGLPFLATVGSVAPFVGLFGTVWGIMHSFTSIASAKDTSLAVVAPGIAEALFATALGLAAAIPAVVAFNQISVSLGRAANRIGPALSNLARRLTRPALETGGVS